MLRFSSFCLYLLFIQVSSAQDNCVALITNPEIGIRGNAQNLLEVVDSINQNPSVSHVVVLGNITAKGVFDEFVWAQEILDGLNVPYFVVGGKNDYLLSEGRGSEILLLWGDDKSFISNNNLGIVCLNTITPEFQDLQYIDVETLNWFEERFQNDNSSRHLIFSYYPLIYAENSNRLLESIRGNKFYSFVTRKDNSMNEKSLSEGFYLNRHNGWGYSLITFRSDSIIIENLMTNNTNKLNSKEILASFAPVQTDKPQENPENNSTTNELWSISYNHSTVTSSIYSNGKIFNGFKAGTVVCTGISGKEKWIYQTNGRIYTSPLKEKDLLLAATNEGDLLSINANTGSLVHVIGIGETITSEICIFDIEDNGVKTKTVIAGTANGNLYCYDLYTLEPMWINQSANNGTANRIISTVTGAENKVVFQDIDGILYCVSGINGLLLWVWKSPNKNTDPLFKTDILIRANNIYFVDAAGNFRCIDALLGTEKWNIRNINASGLIIEKSKYELLIATNKNEILTISTKLGKIVDEIDLSVLAKNDIISDFLFLDDKLITGFSDGKVYITKSKQKTELIFISSSAPVVSLTSIEDKCLVTDYDGNLTLININESK